MYDDGTGVTQDYKEAVKWYKLAAEKGTPIAQYSLGMMYEEGKGVSQDFQATGQLLFKLARKQGGYKCTETPRKNVR